MTRKEAKSKGLKRYFGKVCSKHPEVAGERFIAGRCIRCDRDIAHRHYAKHSVDILLRRRQRYAINNEKIREASRQYYWNHVEECRVRMKQWRINNQESYRECNRLWAINNPERRRNTIQRWKNENRQHMRISRRVHKAIRRGRELKLLPQLTKFDRTRLKVRYATARYLTQASGVIHEVDHIYPLAKGGLHHPDNLQILTRTENRKKWAKVDGR